jgi:hypothetical protein
METALLYKKGAHSSTEGRQFRVFRATPEFSPSNKEPDQVCDRHISLHKARHSAILMMLSPQAW